MTTTLEAPAPTSAAHRAEPTATRLRRILRGGPDDPRWARPGLVALLLVTAVLYLWDLSASGWANSFYAAAVQAGTQSYKAWLFGSLDSGNSITVDKPPAALWIMVASARLFGFNSWSLLVPQALEGVAAVGLLYGAVRRVAGHGAGLLAGAVLALTPAAVLMFRFDNPDALLTLCLVGAGYAMTRALQATSTRWLVLAGSLVGLGFLTKMLQAFLVLPAFALVYLVLADTPVRRRLLQLLAAGAALVVSAGWYVALVEIWPASSRPYIGGSTNNSLLELALGYNGLGRVLGGTGNGGGGAGGAAGSAFGGATGLTRLFSSEMGNEISWLLPAALVALVGGLWVTRRTPRTGLARAGLLLWGGWLLVTGIVFSYMQGTIHPYYTVALAPALAGVLAIGVRQMWLQRSSITGRLLLAGTAVAAGGWSYVLLARTSSWHPELRFVVAAATVAAVVGVLLPIGRLGRATALVVVTGLLAGILGIGAFGTATAASAHSGSIPSVGPAAAASAGGGMGGTGGRPSGTGGPPTSSSGSRSGTPPTGQGGSGARSSSSGSATSGGSSSAATSESGASAGQGGSGSAALSSALSTTSTRWAAAVAGDQSAAELELSSGTSVMAIGGWSGSDASPTLAQFKAYVAAGEITYYISAGNGGGLGGSTGSAAQIASWVAAHYTATTIGGTTVYTLTSTTG